MSPTVVAGGVVLQNFGLAAGILSVTPTSLAFNVTIRCAHRQPIR